MATPALPRRRGRLGRWLRRPSTAVALLGVAVAVGVVQGQPPPAVRDSGRSVPVRDVDETPRAESTPPRSVGVLLVVVDGGVVRFDSLSRSARRVPLPRGLTALRAYTRDGYDVVLGRTTGTRTVAYVLRAGRPPRALGATELALPSADGTAVWLVARRVAIRVPLAGGPVRRVPLPPKSRLVGDTPVGLVVSTGTVPDPKLPTDEEEPTPTATATATAPTGTVPATAGGTPTGTRSPSPAPTPSPTVPPYTTASPVPSTGPTGVPLTTLLVRPDGRTRYLAGMEALAATGDVVLLRDGFRRLAILSPAAPPGTEPRLLPKLQAIEAIGPGALDARGRTFAVLGRTNDYAWLMVGSTDATTNGAINVVALDGGAPVVGAAPPAFRVSGGVLRVRPDGRIVYYTPGEPAGFTVANELPPATAVAEA